MKQCIGSLRIAVTGLANTACVYYISVTFLKVNRIFINRDFPFRVLLCYEGSMAVSYKTNPFSKKLEVYICIL